MITAGMIGRLGAASSVASTDTILVYQAGKLVRATPAQIAAAEGADGTFTANGTSAVTVSNANVTANSTIVITLKTVGGTVGAIPAIQTITAGTGFTVKATASDTSVYNYKIIG